MKILRKICARQNLFSTTFVGLLTMTVVFSSLSTFSISHAQVTENFWTTKASMPSPRSGLGVAVVYGKIYAIGGWGSIGDLNTTLEYDPATNTWVTKKPMPTARRNFGIAPYQNKIYVIGGQVGEQDPTGVNEAYDPLTDTWETKTSMPTPRKYLDANVVNGKIYMIGGCQYVPLSNNLDVNEVYDPATDSWTTKRPIPTGVEGYASAVVNNKIYILGGAVGLALNQIYDPKTNTWSQGASLPNGVDFAAAGATTAVAAPKRIYVIGGKQNLDSVNLNQIYDPETDTWTTGNSIPTLRYGLAVGVVNDVLYAIGGSLGWLKPMTAVNEQYTPIGFGTISPDNMPPTISIIFPENKTHSVNKVSLTFAVSESTSWIGYSLDGQANATIAGNTTITGLPDGPHILVVYAKDNAGNTGASETIYFSIVSPPPDLNGEIFLITNWIFWGMIIIAIVGAALLVYKRIRRKTGGRKKTKS